MVGSRQTHLLSRFRFLTITASLLVGAAVSFAQTDIANEEDGLYKLGPRDTISVTVFGEPEVAAERRIDARGRVNLPLLGSVLVRDLSVVQAEGVIQRRYIGMEIFIDPQVSVSVVEYAPREVSVLGQVGSPGKKTMPSDILELSIVDVITTAGGFNRIAKGDGVRITRRDEDGQEEVFVINVERLINGKGSEEPFMVKPGDIVFVPERVF